MYHIVMIDECKIQEGKLHPIIDSEPQYISVKHATEAMEETKKFIGDVTFTHFWGTWEGKRVMFFCYDMIEGAGLQPNKQATIAYLQQCIPGTMHVIFGPVVGLLDPELW